MYMHPTAAYVGLSKTQHPHRPILPSRSAPILWQSGTFYRGALPEVRALVEDLWWGNHPVVVREDETAVSLGRTDRQLLGSRSWGERIPHRDGNTSLRLRCAIGRN